MSAVIIDLSNVWWTSWHACESVPDTTRAVTAAVMRYATSTEGVDGRVAIVVDRGSHRYALLEEQGVAYKGDRPLKDARAVEGLRSIEGQLVDLGWEVVSVDGYEADDVMASLALALVGEDPDEEGRVSDVTIYTSDKDLLEIVSDRVAVVSVLTDQVYDSVEAVEERLGVRPEQVPDLLCLCGDKADAIPGVPGVGPKTASTLLQTYGSVTSIAAAVDAGEAVSTPARQAALEEHIGQAVSVRDIVRLRVDLPLEVEVIERIAAGYAATTLEAPESSRPTLDAERPPSSEHPTLPSSEPRRAPREGEYWSDLDHKMQYAEMLYRSRAYGSRYATAEDILVTIEAGAELGFGPLQALRSFHILDGRPTIAAQALMGLCVQHPSCAAFRVDFARSDAERATIVIQRVGEEPQDVTFTRSEAEAAGLTSRKNWKMYAADMLVNRCIARAARFGFPEVAANLYTPEDFNGRS